LNIVSHSKNSTDPSIDTNTFVHFLLQVNQRDNLRVRYDYRVKTKGSNKNVTGFTFRLRGLAIVEYNETNGQAGFQSGSGNDQIIRVASLRNFTWGAITELPITGSIRHFYVIATAPNGDFVKFIFHVTTATAALDGIQLSPNAMKMDVEMTYTFVANSSKVALVFWMETNNIQKTVQDLGDGTKTKEVKVSSGYFAWNTTAVDGNGTLFNVIADQPTNSSASDGDLDDNSSHKGDTSRGDDDDDKDDDQDDEKRYRFIFSMDTQYRKDGKLQMTWDPEIGADGTITATSAATTTAASVVMLVLALVQLLNF
jgi:hypothetical protein